MTSNPTKRLISAQTAARGARSVICALIVACALSGCASVEKSLRKVPGIEFKSWSHADRYGAFTDSVVMSGAKWTLNPDGSATLSLDHYDGSAAWAGMIGPHDVIEQLVIDFAAESPQAQMLSKGIPPPANLRR